MADRCVSEINNLGRGQVGSRDKVQEQSLMTSLVGSMDALTCAVETVTIQVRVEPNNVELGVQLQMPGGWTLGQMIERVDKDSKMAIYRRRGVQLVSAGSHGRPLYNLQDVDARKQKLSELNISPATRHPCLNLVYRNVNTPLSLAAAQQIRLKQQLITPPNSPARLGSKSLPGSPVIRSSKGISKPSSRWRDRQKYCRAIIRTPRDQRSTSMCKVNFV